MPHPSTRAPVPLGGSPAAWFCGVLGYTASRSHTCPVPSEISLWSYCVGHVHPALHPGAPGLSVLDCEARWKSDPDLPMERTW